GDLPVVTSVFPLGLRRGTETDVTVLGVFLDRPSVRVKAPADAVLGSRIPVPGTANGELDTPGKSNVWSFQAKKGERLIVETNARRLASELDSVIEILDAKGNPVPRATLRSLAKTYVTFRDHDS